jgi:small-conductance mechanosensitive channel/CRP-like cAMP-binding protein
MVRKLNLLIIPSLLFAVVFAASHRYWDLLNSAVPQNQELVVRILLASLEVVLIFSSAFLILRMVNVFFWYIFLEKILKKNVPKLATDFTSILILFSAFVYTLSNVFHKSLTNIIATSSVVGIMLGFALRAIIADIFSGVAVSLEESIKVGDWINYHEPRRDQNIVGQILEINWRATKIKTEEGNMVVIPNSLLTLTTVTVFSYPDSSGRYEIPIVLDPDLPVEHARRILQSAALEAGRTLGFKDNMPIKVLAHGGTELGIEYRIRYWIDQWAGITPSLARDKMMSAVLHHLHQAGLSIAKPHYDVHSIAEAELDPHLTILKILTRVDLFQTLTRRQLDWLADNVIRRSLRQGELAIRKGEPGSSMFIVLEGLLEERDESEGGSRVVLSNLSPGDFFGEASLLTGEFREAFVVSVTDSLLIEVSKDSLATLIQESPSLVEHLSQVMAKRNVESNKTLSDVPLSEKSMVAAGLADQFKKSILNFFKYYFMNAG